MVRAPRPYTFSLFQICLLTLSLLIVGTVTDDDTEWPGDDVGDIGYAQADDDDDDDGEGDSDVSRCRKYSVLARSLYIAQGWENDSAALPNQVSECSPLSEIRDVLAAFASYTKLLIETAANSTFLGVGWCFCSQHAGEAQGLG